MKPAHRVIVRACSLLAGRSGAGIVSLALISMVPAWGQSAWPSYPSNTAISVTSGGNVGIGTTNPGQKLEVADTNAIKLGSAYISSGLPSLNHAVFASNALFNGGAWLIPNATTNSQALQFYNGATYFLQTQTPGGADWQFRFTIGNNGNVGIGTANPQYRLSVEGAIGARDIVVTNAPWSDYVFRPGYRLRPLSEVNAYIQAHHHLPDIPSEAEVKEHGVSLGEMQARLLAKVEELTLHMIQQEQANRELRERIAQMETRVAKVSARAAAKSGSAKSGSQR